MRNWWIYAHIAGVLAFLSAHGASMVVLYRIRHERDRAKILSFITLAGETTVPMYVALVVLVVAGIGAGIQLDWFGGIPGDPMSSLWLWASIVILVVTSGLMTAVAKPYFSRIKAACEVRPTGVPRVADEELDQILTSARAHLITAIGVLGLLVILYLMLFKPGVG
jgi:hypothetical protein